MSNEIEGCGNHSCLISKPVGQGTSGGCSCINTNMSLTEMIRVKGKIHQLKQQNAELEKALKIACIKFVKAVRCEAFGDQFVEDCKKHAKINKELVL